MRSFLLSVVALLCAIGSANAQPLIDRIPANAVVYAGWYGPEDIAASYDGSHLQGVIAASQFPELIHQFVPALFDRLAVSERRQADLIRAIGALTHTALRHTSAIYIGELTTGQQHQPSPHLVILIDAGDEAQTLLEQVQGVLFDIGVTPLPILAAESDGLLQITIGIGANPAGTLADNRNFQSALQQIDADPVAIFYMDAERILPSIDALARGSHQWPTIKSALGLGQLQRVAFSAGFDGTDWRTRGYVQAPAPRTGLLTLLDGAAVSPEALHLVPESALTASIFAVDAGHLFDATRSAVAAIDPQSGAAFDRTIAAFDQKAGIDLRNQLLQSLGTEWVTYKDQSVGGSSALATVLINRTANADGLDQSLARLVPLLNDLLEDNRMEIALKFEKTMIGDAEVYYLNFTGLAPCWTVHEGRLYAALYPQVIDAAIRQASATDRKTLADNTSFNALVQQAEARGFSSAHYADLKTLMPANYGGTMTLFRYLGLADMVGVKSPPLVLPAIDRLMPHLQPAASFCWMDEDGWHFQQLEPFPLAITLASTDVMANNAIQVPLIVSVMLPSLNRAREAANRIKSASNLRQIGQGCLLYSMEYNRAMPPSLGDIYLTQEIRTEAFVSPRSHTVLPDDLEGQAMADWINENADYVYLASGMKATAHPDTVVAFEKVKDSQGSNVLFMDGSVMWVSLPELDKMAEKGGFEVVYLD